MSKKTGGQPKVTIAQAVRDIFLAAINKGQFLVAILGLILVIIAWRLPSDDLSKFASNIVEDLKNGYLLGYFLFIISLGGWFIHAKRLRRTAHHEHKRIGLEKSELQEKALPGKVKSSKRR